MRSQISPGIFPLTSHRLPLTLFAVETGRSAARLARLLREQEVPGSNPGAPILVKRARQSISAGGLVLLRSLEARRLLPTLWLGITDEFGAGPLA